MPEDSQRDGLTESEPARKNKPKVVAVSIPYPHVTSFFFVNEKLYKYAQDCDNRTQCSHTITLDSDYNGDVYFYYYLENFYQNHRRYVKSRNDLQYLGNLDEISECEPFTKVDGKVIVPCGAVANSMFNDTFQVTYNGVEVPVTEEGVVWEVDKDRKFANPPGNDLCTAINPSIYAKPPNWKDNICEKKNGLQNVDFIVWMRTAALPNFRKLWRKLDRSKPGFEGGLKKGDYVISITNNYPVKSFGGDKGFIISTSSWAGGKNNFLGIAYLVVGGVAVLLGIVFVAIHLRFGHSISELSNLQQHRE